MSADRRLRQLHHRAELGNRQLGAVEQQQQAAAGRIRQDAEVVEDRAVSQQFLSIRISGWSVTCSRHVCQLPTTWKSSSSRASPAGRYKTPVPTFTWHKARTVACYF